MEKVLKNISNISVSKECYKKLKIISIEEETSIQEVVTDILEKVTSNKSKKNNNNVTSIVAEGN